MTLRVGVDPLGVGWVNLWGVRINPLGVGLNPFGGGAAPLGVGGGQKFILLKLLKITSVLLRSDFNRP